MLPGKEIDDTFTFRGKKVLFAISKSQASFKILLPMAFGARQSRKVGGGQMESWELPFKNNVYDLYTPLHIFIFREKK